MDNIKISSDHKIEAMKTAINPAHSNSLRQHAFTIFPAEDALRSAPQPLMSEINMTPLVDVMLVLLIVFMVTLPVLNSTLNITLPKTATTHTVPLNSATTIDLAIDAQGQIYWNQHPIDDSTLIKKIKEASSVPSSHIYLHADRTTHYERIAQIIALAQQYGITQLGFITESKK